MKKQRTLVLLISVIITTATIAACTRIAGRYLDLDPPENRIRVEKNIMVPMRDGVRLATDLYFPKGQEGPFPVVMTRLPYDKDNLSFVGKLFAQRGYVYVAQDCRACYNSEGDVFIPMVYEKEDGMDTVEWVADKDWYNGELGTWGPSYLGITQWAIAANNPHLKTMYPQITTARMDRAIFTGGAFHYRLSTGWSSGVGKQNESGSPVPMGEEVDWDTEGFFNAPLQPEVDIDFESLKGLSVDELSTKVAQAMGIPENEIPPDFVSRMIGLMSYPGFTENVDAFNFHDNYKYVDSPALMVAGWYDIFIDGQLQDFIAMRNMAPEPAAKNTRIIIGPWGHVSGVHPDAKKGARLGAMIKDLMVFDWYDNWLRGEPNSVNESAPIKIYVMGKNVWRDEQEWPLARTRYTKLYLHSGGDANTREGDGELSLEKPADEPFDSYSYDPRDPVPTLGGNNLLENVGAKKQKDIEMREDVLVFTSAPMTDEFEVTGPIEAVIYASSSAVDTDFTVKVCDVYPDGTSYNITEGIVRARYRDSLVAPSLLKSGDVYEFRVPVWPTSNAFMPGHRIRVQVSSSNFPLYDRNTNAGGEGGLSNVVVAKQKIYHDAERPSHLVLPVIP